MTDNARMRSPRSLLLGLLLLTLVVRGLLPIVHGSMMAAESDNPLLAAFCGTSAAALAAKTNASAPWAAELTQSQSEELSELSACPLCVAATAALALLLFALLLLSLRIVQPPALFRRRIQSRDACRRPPARAPPITFPIAI